MRKSHPRPTNPEDFEILATNLLRGHWKCEQVERYSTPGGAQEGIDIIDLSGKDPLRAAQCKLHKDNKPITSREIEDEVAKAREFKPPLGLYVILTTANGNKRAHDTVIAINRQHRQERLFEVQVMTWNRIEELLDQYPEVRDGYEGGLPARTVAKLDMRLNNIEVNLETRTAEEREDQFHLEIDEVQDHINSHSYQFAKLLIQRIRTRHWSQLTERHKFRLLTCLAVVAMGEDDWKRAGDLFLEARTHQPDDEKAQVNEVLAYQLFGECDKAFTAADKLREKYPTSERLFGIWVRNAPDTMTFTDVESAVPTNVAVEGEAAVSLAFRAMDSGDLVTAEKYARAATKSTPTWSTTWGTLGIIIFEQEKNRSWMAYGFNNNYYDRAKLSEAQALFSTAVSCAKTEKSSIRLVEALLNRSRVNIFLDSEKEACADIDEAFRLLPEDPNVLIAYAQSYWLRGDARRAIEILRRGPTAIMPYNAQIMLAALLMERGSSGDYRDASELCSALAKEPDDMPPDFREHVIEVGLDAFSKDTRIHAGEGLLSELPAGTVSKVGISTLWAKFHRLAGDSEKASSSADQAREALSENTSLHDIRRLAAELSELGRYKDALALWQRVAVPSVLSIDTHRLLECASRLERHDIMLETFRALRAAGVVDREMLEYEIGLLEMYDNESAIALLKQQIAISGDPKLTLRLSLLGLQLDRSELIERDPSCLPSVDEVDPRTGLLAVQVLRCTDPMQAVQYAYELLRRHFDDIWAHRAFLAALAPFNPDPEISKPEIAEVGAAVCYLENREQTHRWIIIEDSENPDAKLNEFASDHPTCQQILGKKVSEQFTLAEGVQNRTAEIKQILSKYVYRYQDCMGQWQVRFPGTRDIQMVNIGAKVDESGLKNLDFSAIQRSVDQRFEDIVKTNQLYESQQITVHLVAKHLGTNVFEAMQHLASQLDVSVRCCIGSADERTEAARALRSSNTVVLEMSAIGSLFLLDRLEILDAWSGDIIVSQSTVSKLRQMLVNQVKLESRESGVLVKSESGFQMVENSPERNSEYIERVRGLIRVIEKKCRIVPCPALAAIDPEERNTLIKAFGQHGAESIVFASVPRTVLWTDDHIQAVFARQEYGVKHVWTQLVVGARADSGAVESKVYFDVSAKLAGFGYFFTSMDPQILRYAGDLACWKVDEWPFAQALALLEHDSIDIKTAVQVTTAFLPLLYKEKLLLDPKSAVTLRMLDHLSNKKDGFVGILALKKVLPRIFGLNVLGETAANQTIDAWLAANKKRPLR